MFVVYAILLFAASQCIIGSISCTYVNIVGFLLSEMYKVWSGTLSLYSPIAVQGVHDSRQLELHGRAYYRLDCM